MMGGYGHRGGWAGLELSKDQQQKIDQLRQQHFQDKQKLRTQLYQEMARMRSLAATENPDLDAIGKAFDQISSTRKQMFLNRLEMFHKMDQVLTPAQRKTMQERY